MSEVELTEKEEEQGLLEAMKEGKREEPTLKNRIALKNGLKPFKCRYP